VLPAIKVPIKETFMLYIVFRKMYREVERIDHVFTVDPKQRQVIFYMLLIADTCLKFSFHNEFLYPNVLLNESLCFKIPAALPQSCSISEIASENCASKDNWRAES
jgi:hypothetical protein